MKSKTHRSHSESQSFICQIDSSTTNENNEIASDPVGGYALCPPTDPALHQHIGQHWLAAAYCRLPLADVRELSLFASGRLGMPALRARRLPSHSDGRAPETPGRGKFPPPTPPHGPPLTGGEGRGRRGDLGDFGEVIEGAVHFEKVLKHCAVHSVGAYGPHLSTARLLYVHLQSQSFMDGLKFN